MAPASVFDAESTALITGAASGVGLAIAQLCRGHGMKLALVDNNATNLKLAKESLTKDSDIATETYEVDVGDESAWEGLRDGVKERLGGMDLLVLNAGVAKKGGWENGKYFREIMHTNFFGVTNGINAILPLIQSQQTQRPSAIVITGSKQGITNPPGNPVCLVPYIFLALLSIYYTTTYHHHLPTLPLHMSIHPLPTLPPLPPHHTNPLPPTQRHTTHPKAASKSLSEHLSHDLRATSTSLHLLIPGWTFTGIGGVGGDSGGPASKKGKPDGAWEPGQVAGFLDRAMGEGRFWVICPDNDVSEDTDRRRMLWTAGDAVYGRPPLSRWREEFKELSTREMAGME